jgi:uncharacterized protein YutE (UPF0331/DUF86 family)
MVKLDLITAKLAELGERIERARRHCPTDASALASQRDDLDIVAFNLMLAVQTCADVASHIIADERWPPATTLAGAFASLHDHGVLTVATADALGRAAGLRNVIAHGYAGVDVPKVHAAATRGLTDLEAFQAQVAIWARARAAVKP